MPDLSVFPDAEQVLLDLLADLAAGAPVTVLPPDLQERLPMIRVRRIGGDDDRISDIARVDVEVYAATRAQATPLAEQVRQRLISRPARTPHGVIDRGRTEVAPHEVPYTDPAVRLLTATYRVTLRRRTAS